MRFTFNLVDEPWVPCIDADGHARELGLREALIQAHELEELGGESPLVTAALYRLLLAVLHRVFGPPGYDAWYGLWKAGFLDPAPVGDYLARWRHRFDLFDAERPFYQAADDRVKPKSVNSLVTDLAFGNKATLFDHTTDAEGIVLSPAEGARAVVAAQSFGLAGLSGLPQKFTDGSCTRGVLFLVRGEMLFETLMLNLLRYPDDDAMVHTPDDRPAWEMEDPFAPDRSLPYGYLDYLTWQNRRILTLPEGTPETPEIRQMTVAPGLRLDRDVLGRDPMKHYRVDEKRGPLVQRFHEDRVLWRDSAALFKLHDKGFRPPRAFLWLADLIEDGGSDLQRSQTRRYVALGMANNQAKVYFYRCEQMPLPLRYLTEQALVDRLDDALKMTEDVRKQLWGASRTLATYLLSPQADASEGRKPAREDLDSLTEQWAVERDYWSRLEMPFRRLVEDLPGGPESALAGWGTTLRRTAWSAFDRVSRDVGARPRGLKAEVRAREQLAAGLAKELPKDE